MEVFLTAFYTLFLGYLLVKWSTNQERNNIHKAEIVLFFGIKIAAGFAYAWIHRHYYAGDTWAYYHASQLIFELLPENPTDFFKLTLLPVPTTFPPHLNEIHEAIGYWKDTAAYTMIRLHAILSIFSLGHYSVHVVFWEFLSLIGLLYVYHFIRHFVTDKSKYLLYLLIFVPSLLLWLSGVHKGGVCILGLGLILFQTIKIIKHPQFSYRIAYIVFGIMLLALIRPYILGLLLPALLSLWVSLKHPIYVFYKYIGIYASFGFFALLLGQIFPRFDILAKLVQTQTYFLRNYNGNSDIALQNLEPNVWSLISIAPQALYNVMLRPTFWDMHNKFSVLAGLETMGLILFFIFCVFRSKGIPNKPLFYFCIFFALSYFLLIGLTVDNLGAIFRYRSIPLLFLILGFSSFKFK